MLKFKIVLLGILYCNVYSAVIIRDESSSAQSNSLELTQIEPLSSEEIALLPKVNWPICHEVIVNGLETNLVQPESEEAFVPQTFPDVVKNETNPESDKCKVPNNGGLTKLLREFYNLLPNEFLEAMEQEPTNDLGVQRFSEQFEALYKTNAFVVLRDYACHVLYLDFDFLSSFMRNLFNVNRVWKDGLLSNLENSLPLKQFNQIHKNSLESDEHLKTTIELMKSDTFKNLMKAVCEQPEYLEFKKNLQNNGFCMQEVLKIIQQIFDL